MVLSYIIQNDFRYSNLIQNDFRYSFVVLCSSIIIFLTKRNNIHSFKLIEYVDTMKIAKSKKDEPVNKLTSSMLIA